MFDIPPSVDSPIQSCTTTRYYLENENAEGHERILSSQKDFNDCGMRVLCKGGSGALHSIDENFALIHPGCHMKMLVGKKS